MIVLIVAGGSGTRLWPISTPEYPKHLLTITGEKSLLQNTFDRAKRITSIDKIYISTEVGHAKEVAKQLPELKESQIIIEPARRGTMPCITNALQIIASSYGDEEPIASIWADQQVRATEGFIETFKYAGQVSEQYQKIILIGIEPDAPSVKYGYIKKGEQVEGEPFLHHVEKFKEKPEYTTAQRYVASGDYLWNAGYFVAPYKVFKERIEKFADRHWSEQLQRLKKSKSEDDANEIYLNYKDEAIDTALIEKVPDLLVIPGSFDWLDVGSFDDVHKVSSQDEHGNAIHGEDIHILDSSSVYVRNQDSKPVAVIGMDNVVVVNTEHGVLVMRTDQSQKVKDVVNKLKGEA